MTLPPLPVEIHGLIIAEAGAPSHPLAYSRDYSGTLAALCFVSRSFYAVAAPLLYSSITLTSLQQRKKLARTAETTLQLLPWTHSLRLHLGKHLPDQTSMLIGTYMSALRRFFWSTRTFLSFRAHYDLEECSLPFENFTRFFEVYVSQPVQRLALFRVPFEHEGMVERISKVPYLTHLAFSHLSLDDRFLNGMSQFLDRAPSLRKLILGVNAREERDNSLEKLRVSQSAAISRSLRHTTVVKLELKMVESTASSTALCLRPTFRYGVVRIEHFGPVAWGGLRQRSGWRAACMKRGHRHMHSSIQPLSCV